jgi:hypothetical protein
MDDNGYPGLPPPEPLVMERDAVPGTGARQTPAGAVIIWEGTTWDGCPTVLACLSPVRPHPLSPAVPLIRQQMRRPLSDMQVIYSSTADSSP